MSLSELQTKFEGLELRYDHVLKMAEFKGVEGPEAEKEIIRMYEPKLKNDCLILVELLTDHTIVHGHGKAMDTLKDRVLFILGRCVGEEL